MRRVSDLRAGVCVRVYKYKPKGHPSASINVWFFFDNFIRSIFVLLCTHQNVYPYYEPPETSDQVQTLDLGMQKRIPSTGRIVRIVVSSFNQAGIYIYEDDNMSIVRSDPHKASTVRGVENTNSEIVIIGKKTVPIEQFKILTMD